MSLESRIPRISRIFFREHVPITRSKTEPSLQAGAWNSDPLRKTGVDADTSFTSGKRKKESKSVSLCHTQPNCKYEPQPFQSSDKLCISRRIVRCYFTSESNWLTSFTWFPKQEESWKVALTFTIFNSTSLSQIICNCGTDVRLITFAGGSRLKAHYGTKENQESRINQGSRNLFPKE